MFLKRYLGIILLLNVGFRLVITTKVNKCPTLGCVSRSSPQSPMNNYLLSDDPSQYETPANGDDKQPSILTQIKDATSKRITESSTSRLASSFSQGYIDLGSRDPREEGAATLAFVFDTTGSMYDDLRQVIDGAGKILKTVLEKFERPIHDYVLVPFNDPEIGKMTVTSDPDEFKESLHELQYHIQGGGDCPEMAVGAIKLALEACLPSSYIYVFTDARAKDYYLLDEVLTLIQKKHTQVVFVMTGDCGDKSHPGYQAFETIASTSSGQVFHLNKSDVDEVLNFVRLSLESRKVNLLSVDRKSDEPGGENLQLLVDKTLREFTISVSGQKPKIEIYRPELEGNYTKEEKVDDLLNLENVKIVGVKKPTPGRYNISVESESQYTVRATGLSSIDFQTGFSLRPTTNIKETYHRPMKGGVSNVLVKPLDETEFGDLFRLQLISLDGKVLEDIPLERLPGHETLFRGTSVEAPQEPFNIKVFGRDKEGFQFERISPTAVSSQLPFPPEVIAEEREEGYYDRPSVITCHIQTLVPFNLTWKRDGRDIAGPFGYPQSAEASHVIERPTSRDEGIYTCLASNIAGSSFANVFLDIKEPPPDVSVFGNASLTPGLSGILRCDVRSTVEFNVTWSRYEIRGQVRDFFGRLETVGEFVPIEKNGTKFRSLHNNSLLIDDVSQVDSGWYRCSAANEGGSRAKEIFVEVHSQPEVSVSPVSATFKAGENVTLTCNGRGVPPPSLHWVKGGVSLNAGDPKFVLAKDATALVVLDAKAEDEGTYKCVAQNPAGSAEALSSLVLVEAAKVFAVEEEVLAESGSTATLQCYGEGIPPPTIRWFKEDSSEVLPLSFIEMKNGYLRITGVQESDSGTYTCVASNGVGTAEDQVTLSIGSAPSVLQAPTDNTIEVGAAGGLSCYGIGVPQPNITWHKEGGETLPPHFTQDKSGALRVNGMRIEDEGTYICVLENQYGKKEIKAHLSVSGLLPPLIAAPPNPQIRTVASDSVTLPCTVVMATPSPTINWYFGEKPIELKEGMFVTREGDLRIPFAKPYHEGRYRCEATNVAGNSSLDLYLNVLEPPKLREGRQQEEVRPLHGDRVRLRCPVGGDPTPTYSWQKNGELIQPFQRRIRIGSDGTLLIREVKDVDSGVYVCTAINAAGATNTAVTLTVVVPPEIAKDPETYSIGEREVIDLPCRSSGAPSPSISWKKRTPNLSAPLNSTLPNGSLRIEGRINNEGIYECTASNEAGEAKRIVKLIVNKAPEIYPSGDLSVSVVEGEDLKLPCEVEGHPPPKVSWTKDEEDIPLSESIQRFEGYLLLKNVSSDQRGQYTCRAESRAGVDYKTIDLIVHYAPKIIGITSEGKLKKKLVEGSRVTLPCPGIGDPVPVRSWTKNGNPLHPGRGVFIDSSGTVDIEKANRGHTGIYECTLANDFGYANWTYNITVMVPPMVSQNNERPQVIEGKDIAIRCPVDAFPIPSIKWLKDGVTIFSTKDRADVTHIIVEDNGQTLHIFEATMDDQGTYRCIVRNSAGESSKDFPLRVLIPPQFRRYLHNPSVIGVEGEEVVLDCSVDGDPRPEIEWEKNGFSLPSLFPQVSADGREIRIARVTQVDSGIYVCTATNVAGTAYRTFNLTVFSPPVVESFPGRSGEDFVAIRGQDTRIVCRASGNPTPAISWYFEDGPLNEITNISYTVEEDGQVLNLLSLTTDQSGTYVCNATNEVGTTLKSYNVSVFTSPTLTGDDDHVTQVENLKILADEKLELSCVGEGTPTPTYSWFWENRPLVPSLMSYRANEHQLVIDKVKVENSGTFTCLAVNPAGTAEKHFNIRVQVPAQIGTGRRDGWKAPKMNQEAIVNASITLFCPASGIPEPFISWSKDEKLLDFLWNRESSTGNIESVSHVNGEADFSDITRGSTQRFRLSHSRRRLTIDNATHFDSGVYVCVAENEAGIDRLEFVVSVLAPPKIVRHSESPILIPEKTSLALECDFQGTPRPLATWLVNGADLKTLPLDGVNIISSGDSQTSLLIPKIGREHIGTYTCLVSSVAGSDEVSMEVSVASPPERSTSQFENGPRVIVSRANRPASLHCQVDAFPPPEFEWYKENLPLASSNKKYSLSHDGSILNLIKTTSEDAGNYSCIAVNSAGSASLNFHLEIHVPPHLEEVVEEEVTIEEGKTVRLFCPVKATPSPSILWMKSSNILPSSFTSREPRYLTISNATREDRGRFTCLATNEAGTFEQSYTVNVLVPPKLENENKAFVEETVLVNRQVTVSCFIVAESLLDVEWWKDGWPLSSLKPGTNLDPTKKRLTISQVEVEDTGNYTCVASNPAGKINITTSLQVLVPPHWTKMSDEEEIFAKNGDNLDLECEAGGVPAPSLLWLKDGHILKSDSANIAFKNDGRLLRILSSSDKDSGQYSCVATNPAGTLEKNVKVSIQVPPFLLYDPVSKIKVLENRAVTFDCPVEGKPTPEILWYLNGELMDENSPFIRFSNQRRHVHFLRLSGSGNLTFSCVAKNPVGELVTDFLAEVLRPPIIDQFPLESPVNSVEGDTLNLTCNVEGHPPPKVAWVTEKGTLLTPEETRLRSISLSENGLALTFSPLRRFHQGTYMCLASNEGGRTQASFNVIVNRIPSIEVPVSGTNTSVTQSFPTVLTCNVDSRPEADITWYKDGEDLSVTPDPFLYLTHGNRNLRFLHTLEAHEGVYKCVASNQYGVDELEFQVNVLTPPTIVETSTSHLEVKVGDSFRLECKVEGKPVPKINWRKGDLALRLTSGMELLQENQVLQVEEADVKDAGNYLCVASSGSGTSQMDFEVRIYDPPQILRDEAKEQKAVVGREQIFRCEATGVPPPIITWTRRGSTLHRLVDPNIQISGSGNELILPRVRESDGGQYTCIATSLSGQDSMEYFLAVLVPPTISRANQPKTITGVLGKWTELVCEASGNPRPNITWYREGVLLPFNSSERYKISPRGDRLRIERLAEADHGVHTCEAENEAGLDSRNLTLNILVPPKVPENATIKFRVREGSNVAINCPIHGKPTPAITWFLNSYPLIGQSKGNLEVRNSGRVLSIVRVEKNDAATYVCAGWNAAGSVQHPMELEVLVPPQIAGVSETDQEEEVIKVIEGGHVTFECQLYRGHPQPSRTWFKGSELVSINQTIVGGGERLVISRTTVADADTYECVAENEVGFSVKHFRLEVQTPPRINVTLLKTEGIEVEDTFLDGGILVEFPPDGRPRTSEVRATLSTIEGATITIPCPITGKPEPHILWQKGSHPLILSSRTVVSPAKSSLTLTNILTKESGVYSCVGVNSAGEATFSVAVDVEGPPLLEGDVLEKVRVVSGQTLELECKVRLSLGPRSPSKSTMGGRGPPRHKPLNVTWTKDGIPLSALKSSPILDEDFAESESLNKSGSVIITSDKKNTTTVSASENDNDTLHFVLSRDNFRLTLPRVKEGQDGRFACVVENKAGIVKKMFDVRVLEPPTIQTQDESQEFEAAVGEPIVFECNASGDPPPEVRWQRGQNPFLPGSRHQLLESSHVLIITSVQESDEGEYTCVASNAAGVSVQNFMLTVLVPPVLEGPSEERIEVVSGRAVTLECPANGRPQPTTLWRFDDEILIEEEGIKFKNGSLVIERVSANLAGEYLCDVENTVGRTYKVIHLIVKEAPLISGNQDTELETVIKGQAASLHCSASGYPTPSLHWQKDGHGVRLDSRVSVSWGGRTLLIQDLKSDDAGRYTCTASNSAGNATKQYRLNVLEPPTIEEGPHEVVAVEGEVVTVFCSVSGNPAPKITWLNGGSQISEKLEESRNVILKSEENVLNDIAPAEAPTRGLLASGALQFSPILVNHAGNYSCAAENEAGSAKHDFPVLVLTPPDVTLDLSSPVTTVGGSVEFTCKVEGSPPITYSWKKDKVPIHPGNEYQIMSNGTMVLPFVTLDMAGSYTCSVRNPAGVGEDSQGLIVNELPKVSIGTKEIIVAAGEKAELVCHAEGQPKPSIGWSRPDLAGAEITPKDSRIQITENRLVITPVVSEDMGTYQCTGTNRAGSESANLALVVTSTPEIKEELDEELTALLGETITLSCSPVVGYPPPEIIWRKEGRLLRGSSRVHLATNGRIVIDNAKAEDSGMYSCLVVNAAGRLYRVVNVVVQVPPRLTLLPRTQQVTRGDSLSLTCEAVGVPTPAISWLLNGTEVEGAPLSEGGRGRLVIERAAKADEGTYTCVATNTAGYRKAVAGVRVKVPPVIMSSPGEMTVQELSSVMLTCVVEGDPAPATTWTKEGHYIASSERVRLMKNGSLIIDSSKGSDTGVYKCVASNDAGAAEAVSLLRVTTPPKIIEGPRSKEVEVGQTVVFDCIAEGEPKPELQWSVASGELNSRYKTLTNGSLQLVAVQVEDEGQVICQVFNDLGEDLAKANITVRVAGSWSSWSSWSVCSTVCGPGQQIRQRFCNSPAPRNGGKDCVGDGLVSRQCEDKLCPIHGGWSLWEDWSKCSVTCGSGIHLRRRLCNNPAALHGGDPCDGPDEEKKPCKMRECPVDGSWSSWSEWGSCSRTCGDALKQRTRLCNSPPPYAGGEDCEGEGLEVMICGGKPCKVDGGWSEWRGWSECSVTCGEGIQHRRRNCDNPVPENGGEDCEGADTEEEKCRQRVCVIHGEWSIWSPWSQCSVTCGFGHRQRVRLCNDPAPEGGGQACRGPRKETRPCRTPPCPVHGNWGPWTEWSSCSKTCGPGHRTRTRFCNNPYPRNGGDFCKDSNVETMACKDFSCSDLPLRAYGTIRGWLNGQDLGVISMVGNVTANGNQKTLVVSLSPLLPQFATWLTPLASVVSSAIFSSAYESNGAKNGYSLTKGSFTRDTHVTFGSGEKVDISQTAKGVDESGTLRFNVEVNGDVPYLQPGSFVTVQPFQEEYIQTGVGSLYVSSKRTFAVNGHHHPYTWNETVDYDRSSGTMPFLRESLHANSVSASYRCLSSGEASNTKGELSLMISSVITPSPENSTCPEGFTYSDKKGESPLCLDNDECVSEGVKCSHNCKNLVGGYECQCPEGYEISSDSINCQDIDECLNTPHPCGPREECKNTPGSYVCEYSCRPGFRRTFSGTGCEDIDECAEEEETACEQRCQNLIGSYRCECFRGYNLDASLGHCIDIDECEIYRNPCSHKCINVPGSFECRCPDGFYLLNNGRCKDIDECSTFQHNCTDDQKCRNVDGGFSCVVNCPPGLRLTVNGSCIDVDECAELTAGCHYTQRCENMWGRYRCSCQKGFKSMGPGHPCLDINECQISPPPCNHECRNLFGDYECICASGFRRLPDRKTCIGTYQYAEHSRASQAYYAQPQVRPRPPLSGISSKGYRHRLLRRVYKDKNCPKGFLQDGDQCKDLNECTKPGRCQHKCVNTQGSFHCLCPPGYVLGDDQHSCRDVNECSEEEKGGKSCRESETCFNMRGTYKCVSVTCPIGYTQGDKNRFCRMPCPEDGHPKCPSGAGRSHVILQAWISLPSGVLAYEDILTLAGEDEEGVFVPHSHFTIDAEQTGNVFMVRQENGRGIISSTKSLEHGRQYKFSVDAKAFDGHDEFSVLYTTEFQVLVHISTYPY